MKKSASLCLLTELTSVKTGEVSRTLTEAGVSALAGAAEITVRPAVLRSSAVSKPAALPNLEVFIGGLFPLVLTELLLSIA